MDASSWLELNNGSLITTNGWYNLEVEYIASQLEKSMKLYQSGSQVQSVVFSNTETLVVDSVRLGAMDIETGTRGTILFEDYSSRRFSKIGALPDPGIHENQDTLFTYISQPVESASKDANLYTQYPSNNYGTSSAIFVGDSIYSDGNYRGLIAFDLSSIPEEATITSATLTLTVGAWDYSNNAHTLRVYRSLRSWTESGATWNKYDGTNNWAAGGGFGAADSESQSIGSVNFNNAETVGMKKAISLTPEKVQEWVSGVLTNHGLLLKMDTEADDMWGLASSSHATAAYRPRLVIEYSLSNGSEISEDWVSKEYAYEDEDHKHAVTSVVVTDEEDNQAINTYTYDANGNMTCRVENGNTYLQSYNAENRMSGVSQVDGDCDTPGNLLKVWGFVYDGDGVKVKQVYTEGATTLTTYYYAGGSYELQTDGATQTVRQYYSIAGMNFGMRSGAAWSFFLTNHLGSVVGMTDVSGALTSEVRYMPFGEVRIDVGTISSTDYGFTFQQMVADTGLIDYKARAYDPYLSRWTQPDAILTELFNPQNQNRYSYVNNSPACSNDPTGHCPLCVSAAIGAGVGLIIGAVGYGVYVATTGKDFNWGTFAFAAGGGAAAGALIGTGVGWAAGVSQATATTVAISTAGAVETANVACGGDMCSSEVQEANRVVQGASQNLWTLNPLIRGVKIENILGRSPQLSNNFPVIDRFENGVATSIKSIDLTTKTYQNVTTLSAKVLGYSNSIINWQGTSLQGWAGTTITNTMVQSRSILLAIPPDATSEQIIAIQKVQSSLMSSGLLINTIIIK